MRQIITTLTFLLFAAWASNAQITVTISGAVTDASGDPVEGIDINIVVDSTNVANFPGYYNTLQTGADGSYSDTFDVPDQLTQGLIYVSMTDCDGDIITKTTYWSPVDAGTVDFDYCAPDDCEVSIQSNPANGLLAVPAGGSTPYAYMWSTGALTASIQPNAPGTYCVTITDANGCQASDCFDYNSGGNCGVSIIQIQGTTILEANASGIAPYTYAWSTGEVTQSINYTSADTYCVTATDANGCQAIDCIVTGGTLDNYQVSGGIYLPDSSNFAQLSGWAYLYEVANDGSVTLIDSTEFLNSPNGTWYDFGDVDAGTYIVLASLSPNSAGSNDYLPTYYGDVIWWDEATVINIPYPGYFTYGITLTDGNNPGGPGLIGGNITGDENINGGEIEIRDDEALANVTVILTTESDEPVAHTKTDMNGAFLFEDLDWGAYKVYVEIPGMQQAYYLVTIGPDNPSVENLNFFVTDSSVTSVEEEVLEAAVSVFPNPVQTNVQVRVNKEMVNVPVDIQIMNRNGQLISRKRLAPNKGEQQVEVDMSALPTGLYLITIGTNQTVITKKVVKE